MDDNILQMVNILKEFSGVKALSDVSFGVKKGEIHALVGENGAGKSTMMKVLCGIYPYGSFEGKLIYDGKEQQFMNIKDSETAGIAIIFQELTLIKAMSICENIFLGDEIKANGVIKWNEQIRITAELLKKLHLDIDPMTIVGELGVGKQQLIEVAKALNKKARLLILDEPTSSLTDVDTKNLLQIIKELKSEGTTCIYISHKLNEIFEIADTVTVIRDGKAIITEKIENFDEDKIVSYMVGRELTEHFPRKPHIPGETVLELKNWTVMNPEMPGKKLLDDINLVVKKGEILGLAGLMGAGRTELALSMFGIYKPESESKMLINGEEVSANSPKKAIDLGIGYVSEDRKRYGLILQSDIKTNISLASLRKFCRMGSIVTNEEILKSQEYMELLKIKASSIYQETGSLSGGNQQKVVLSKWLLTNPRILILDEPTRGIDVGAKVEIYNEMNNLIDQGMCIIMISSEMSEILGMSDRIYVMSEGKIKGSFDWQEATQENILSCAIGGKR
jgi:ABC-type sugar transport system, ATPase component